jgi:hypothetical protein
MNNVFAAGIPPLFGLIIKEFHCNSQQVSQLASYTILALGLAVRAPNNTMDTLWHSISPYPFRSKVYQRIG